MNASAQAARLKKKEPEKLPPWMVKMCLVVVPLATLLFCVGTLGLLVLMDEPDRKRALSQTAFAATWRAITQQFPFITPFCFNGGMVTVIMLGSKLHEHSKARKAEAAAKKAPGKKTN